MSYLHARDERREAEGALAEERVHVEPQLLFDPRAVLSRLDAVHLAEDAGKQGAEQLLG